MSDQAKEIRVRIGQLPGEAKVTVGDVDVTHMLNGIEVVSRAGALTECCLSVVPGKLTDLEAVLAREGVTLWSETVRELAKWTQHHADCARGVEAGACSCGLNAAWLAILGPRASPTRGQTVLNIGGH